jgi:anti-anti-sigma factor
MLDIRKDMDNFTLIINLSGEMDLSNHMALIHIVENIKKDNYKEAIIDMQNLKFVDSTGIKTLIDMSKLIMETHNDKLKIKNVCEEIKEIFDLLNIEEVLGEEVFQ